MCEVSERNEIESRIRIIEIVFRLYKHSQCECIQSE